MTAAAAIYFFPGVTQLRARQELAILRNALDFRFLFAYSAGR